MIFWNNESRFLAGWEIDFDNTEELKKNLLTQGVNRDAFHYFSSLQTAIELIINPQTFESAWYDGSIAVTDQVTFQEQRFKAVDKLNSLGDQHMLCGVPLWYQAPDIPVCPKTGALMQYVCTINSDSAIGVEDKNGIKDLPFGNYLTFGDYGRLYVFYQPDSKVVYLRIQF